uniref:Apoptosis inhibitor 5 n=1 Tax=Kalanchoe fedtschenkoi TaxID=63787 RepID=A0A7N0UNH3_KALFE
MAEVSDEAKDIEKLYEFGERLNEAKDKSQHVKDYEGILGAAKGSIKAKQLTAQLIPRFFKYFPNLHDRAVDAHFDLCEEEELGVRVQAIRGLPLFSKDTPEYLPKIVDVLVQLLPAEENVERDAVHKAIMSLLRQDVKVTGQPSDRIGEDFSEISKEFGERLRNIEEIAKSSQKKLTQGMADHHKAISAAKSDEAKDDIKNQRKNSTNGLKICNNILAMTQPLHSKSPSFIGDKRINLSWKDALKPTTSANNVAAGGKRPATVSTDAPSKKGRGSGNLQTKLVNKALEGISQGDGRGDTRGGRSRGRGWGNRGRGGGYW